MVVGELSVSTDVLVIGGGPGGYVATIRAAQLGKKVILVDKDGVFGLGGECLLRGCIPSKTLIHAANVFSEISEGEKIGITATSVKADLQKIVSWKNRVIKQLNLGINYLMKENKVEVLKGRAFFDSSTKALVETETGLQGIEFKKAIIATGSKSSTIKGFEVDGKNVIGSKEALDLTELPAELVVIGGGYIGLELGTYFSKLGSKVKIVEFMPQLLPGTDFELVEVVQKNLEKNGVEIFLNSKSESIRKENEKIIVSVNSSEKGKIELQCDKVLVCVGRKPYIEGLQLEHTKVKINEKGFIKVNERLQTDDENIYAIGDVAQRLVVEGFAGNSMLAHKAYKEGKIVAEVIAGKNSAFDNKCIPSVVFSKPEIAIVGLSEMEAIEKGFKVKIGKFPFRTLGRSLTMNETEGFVKIIANAENEIVLGVQIVGANASDLISEAALAIEMNSTLEDLALTIHPHPSFSEALSESAEQALGKAIHVANKKL